MENAPEPVGCGHCGEVIPGGTLAVVQKIYAWPDSGETGEPPHHGGTSAGVAAGTTARTSAAGWRNLSRATQNRFRSGGLGRGLGHRSEAMAQRLYERLVPKAIRNLGEPAVRDYLKGKQFSHVESVKNAPGLAKDPSNVILEKAASNLSRGSRNMTNTELAAARSAARGSAIRSGAKVIVKGGARAGLVAAAMEAVVSAPENILHYRRGRKSGDQAAKDTIKSTAAAGVIGTAVAVPLKAVGALSLGALSTPLMVVAGAGLVGNAAYRLAKAARRDFPADEYRTFFCWDKLCKTRFAESLTMAARETSVA